jgi:H+-transporting ATPase
MSSGRFHNWWPLTAPLPVRGSFAACFAERCSAGESTAAALVARLAPSRQAFWVLRDGPWSEENAEALEVGDIIHIRSGHVVPADARLLEEHASGSPPMNVEIDESAITGDRLLAAKTPGDVVYADSACAEG